MPRRGCHAFLLTLVTAGSVASMMATPAASAVQSLPQAADSGGGEFVIPKVPHLTNEQRIAIQAQIDRNIAILTAQGRLPAAAAPGVLLGWPLQAQNGVRDFGVHGVSNFVDLDPIFPGSLLDFACGARTYDLSSGNHRGIDYFTWPFPWKRVNNDQVAIVAAAPGTIVLRQDGNFDRSCTFPNNSDWNAVFVRHADGSIAWYGHMKAFSLTSKQVGDSVAQGEFLGIVGSSGNSSGPHLHLEIHDPSGTVVEPHSGPCNPITSWWAQQRPYFDSSVNKMTTGFAAAVMPSCPQEEIPNDSTNFNSGGTVFFTTYYRDQRINQVSQYTIYRPSGAIWTRWTHSITNPHFAASWWWWSFNLAGVEPGIWKFEVVYQGRTFNHSFSIGGPFPVGRVPGDSSLGAPLTVSTAAGGNINLSWSGTCLGSETDYAIYEGVIGDYYSHAIKMCSTGGLASATFLPAAGSSYYLVVPRNAGWEGSYGTDSLFSERPPGIQSCLAQDIGSCCSNGVKDPTEVCDGSDLNGQTCQTQGIGLGTLGCNATCSGFDLAGCVPCGNGIAESPEACDGADLAGQSCSTQGFDSGALACNGTCDGFVTSGCTTVCGDGVRKGLEACDGPDVGSETCSSQGFDGGTLACNGTCDDFVTSGCTTVCGDGVRKGLETCDGADVGSENCLTQGFTGGTLACNATCNGFDVSGCSQCGNNAREGPEVCDGTDLAGETCLSQGHPPGTLACNVDCKAFDFTGCVGF